MTLTPGLGCGIEHIVVLMFENRSFDNILGTLYPRTHTFGDYTFEGLPLDSSNLDAAGKPQTVWTESPPQLDDTAMCTPSPDPGERFQNVNLQLFGKTFPEGTAASALGTAAMGGFVVDYALKKATGDIGSGGLKWPKLPRGHGDAVGRDIMHYFSQTQVPVSTALAQQYAVCDHWFASVATQTFANRMFAHAASSAGGVDDFEILEQHLIEGYDIPTVFQAIDEQNGTSWRIYYDKQAGSYSISEMLLRYVHDRRDDDQRLRDFSPHFAADVKAGLPSYTFIEPNYGHKLLTPKSDHPNSYHPPYNVHDGERLLWSVYNTLKTANPEAWKKTLLIVTFDEHGGCYDHVSPPAVPAAQAGAAPFDRFGVRVPTMLISPQIAPGTIYRADSGSLDHTSILRTVFDCFLGEDVSLHARDKHAPSVASVLTKGEDNPGVTVAPTLPPTVYSEADLARISAHGNHLAEMNELRRGQGSDT